MKRDAQTATKKSVIHKRLSEKFKHKSVTLKQKFQDLIDELSGTRDKANDEVNNLKYLLKIDADNKETLENRVETLENRVVDLEHDCAEATHELAVSLLVEHLLSYYLLLYLPNLLFNFALTLNYKDCQAACHTKS